MLQRALASDLANLGEDHPKVAIRRSNLAFVLRELDQVGEARPLALEALRVARLQPEGSRVRVGVEQASSWAEGSES